MTRLDDPNFNDVRDELEGLSGIFGGDGYRAVGRCSAKMNPDGSGYIYTVSCQGCNANLDIAITWDELLYVMARRKPIDKASGKEWIYDPARGGVYPPVVHSSCGTPVPMLITAQEAQQRVESGIQAHKLSPQYVQNAMMQLGAVPQQQRRHR